MGAVAGVALQAPATPSKPANAVNRVVEQLNDDYNLGLELPDPTRSPSHHKQQAAQNGQFAQSLRIFRGIHFLYYQRGESLELALESFAAEARAASLRWVPKPRADPGTLPSARHPPKAQTPEQQGNLQIILDDLLGRFKAQCRPARPALQPAPPRLAHLPAPTEDSDLSGSLPESPASSGSKRSFDGSQEHDAKRWRGGTPPARAPSPTPSTLSNALENVPTRRRLGRPPEHLASDRRSNSSETSGGSTVSSIFSRRDGQSSTQTTLDEGPREQKGAATIVVPRPPPLDKALAHMQSPLKPSHASTIYSEFPNVSQNNIMGQPAGIWEDDFDSPPVNPEIQARLQNIWRKWSRPPPMRQACCISVC